VLASGAEFLFVCNKDGHKTLYEFIEGAALDQHTVSERKPGKRTLTYRYRSIEARPALVTARMRSSINWLSVTISDEKRKSHLRRRFPDQLANHGRERKWRSPPAPEPAGRSRTKPSTC
jgi:hypothetical protein